MKLNNLGEHQNEVHFEGVSVLFSYNTPVAYYDVKSGLFYKTNKKWSVTTSKHINQWAGKDAALVDQNELDNLVK